MLSFKIIAQLRESEDFWFWISIISLLTLAFAEVMARRASLQIEEYIESHGTQLSDTKIQKRIRTLNLADAFWFWLSISSLIFLGVSEVFSHHFATNKDDVLTATEQENINQYNTRIQELKLAEDKSQERILELKNEILQSEKELTSLKIELHKAEKDLIRKRVNTQR